MSLIDKIANYFKEWDGIDETAPKMELNIKELRYVADMNVERCRLLKKLNKANFALETLEKIKDIIREEEHYEISNSIDNPRPNQADYDAVHAEKFNRIWKVISDAESQNTVN